MSTMHFCSRNLSIIICYHIRFIRYTYSRYLLKFNLYLNECSKYRCMHLCELSFVIKGYIVVFKIHESYTQNLICSIYPLLQILNSLFFIFVEVKLLSSNQTHANVCTPCQRSHHHQCAIFSNSTIT